MQNSVPVSQIALAEIEVFKSVGWKLPQLICPLDIIKNVSFLLGLNVQNNLTELVFFSENITNFLIWSKWGEFSVFSIAISSLVAFCEFNDYINCVKKILNFSIELSNLVGSDLASEISAARNFVFINLKHLSDDKDLVNKAEGLTNISLYDDKMEQIYTDLEVV